MVENDDRRAGWSAAWGVVAAIFGAGSAAAWIAALQPDSGVPRWTAYATTGLTVVGLYLCFASLAGWWPARPSTLTAPIMPVGVSTPQVLPLAIQITDCRDLNHVINSWALYAIHVEIRNRGNRAIKVTEVYCGAENDAPPSQARRENGQFIRGYKPPLPDNFRLRPVSTMSGWQIVSAPAKYPRLRGNLRITVTLTDENLQIYTATREFAV